MDFSPAQKEGCCEILYQLDISDLLSLYETIIKNKTTIRVKAELIRKIIDESKTAEELLKRKKVYRDTIVEYLNKKKIFVYANCTKHDAIKKLLEYWGSSDTSVTEKSNAAEMSRSHFNSVLDHMSDQITNLFINKDQEVINHLDKAELDAKTSPKTVTKATSSKKAPQKSKKVPCPEENAPSTSTITNQSGDNSAYTDISMLGIKPKGETTSTKSISFIKMSLSEETTTKSPNDTKGRKTKRN